MYGLFSRCQPEGEEDTSYFKIGGGAGLVAATVIMASLAVGVSPGMAAGNPAGSTPAVSTSSADPSSPNFTGTPLADQQVVPSSGASASLAGGPDVLPCACDGGGGSSSGNTHCFTTDDHAGCQLDHSTSVEVVSDTAAGELGLAAFIVCDVGTPVLGAACAVATAIVSNEILGSITVMPPGECLEFGLMYFFPKPYAKTISCSIE